MFILAHIEHSTSYGLQGSSFTSSAIRAALGTSIMDPILYLIVVSELAKTL
jgi:hypothetical protein